MACENAKGKIVERIEFDAGDAPAPAYYHIIGDAINTGMRDASASFRLYPTCYAEKPSDKVIIYGGGNQYKAASLGSNRYIKFDYTISENTAKKWANQGYAVKFKLEFKRWCNEMWITDDTKTLNILAPVIKDAEIIAVEYPQGDVIAGEVVRLAATIKNVGNVGAPFVLAAAVFDADGNETESLPYCPVNLGVGETVKRFWNVQIPASFIPGVNYEFGWRIMDAYSEGAETQDGVYYTGGLLIEPEYDRDIRAFYIKEGEVLPPETLLEGKGKIKTFSIPQTVLVDSPAPVSLSFVNTGGNDTFQIEFLVKDSAGKIRDNKIQEIGLAAGAEYSLNAVLTVPADASGYVDFMGIVRHKE